jgi:hypothetical protein
VLCAVNILPPLFLISFFCAVWSAGSASRKSIHRAPQRGRPPIARTQQELEEIKQRKLETARAKRAAMTAEEKEAANEKRRKN